MIICWKSIRGPHPPPPLTWMIYPRIRSASAESLEVLGCAGRATAVNLALMSAWTVHDKLSRGRPSLCLCSKHVKGWLAACCSTVLLHASMRAPMQYCKDTKPCAQRVGHNQPHRVRAIKNAIPFNARLPDQPCSTVHGPWLSVGSTVAQMAPQGCSYTKACNHTLRDLQARMAQKE